MLVAIVIVAFAMLVAAGLVILRALRRALNSTRSSGTWFRPPAPTATRGSAAGASGSSCTRRIRVQIEPPWNLLTGRSSRFSP
jgi:hypothetical protein